MDPTTLIIFILAFAGMVIIHEFGHFITARGAGVKVSKFFIGFGPTLWSRQAGETEYGVKAFPLGGFVKIIGMSPYEEVAAEALEEARP